MKKKFGFRVAMRVVVPIVLFVGIIEATRIANMFNCKLGQLLLTYLGITIGDRVVNKNTTGKIISKLECKLDN